jgi:hypothetical protein
LHVQRFNASTITAWIPLRKNSAPDYFFLFLIHKNPISYLGHSASATTADIVKGS